MEIRITGKQILKALCVFSWMLFITVCIEAGGFIFNTIFVLLINPVAANRFWMDIDLSALYAQDKGYFLVITTLMIIVALFRALIFYLIVKMFYDKQLSLSKPFQEKLPWFTSRIAYLALGAGLFSLWGVKYTEWLMKKGVDMPDIHYMRMGGADVWLFMGMVLLVIAQVFKRGIEIQSENELTV